MSLARITETLESKLSAFAGLGAKVAFDLGEDGVISVDATVSPPVLSDELEGAGCTIRISTENLVELIDGALNPMLAFTLGKLKIEGDMGIALKVADLLEE